ncbi:hypothetical protein FB446DRAFT_748707 [Lentinula raphanica]|nr:hypothetical protein FB446DRAFT_748707 [Lentinula raphanica]
MLHRLCHPFRFLSFSLLWCTTLCHIFALASPLIRRGVPAIGKFSLYLSWGIPGLGQTPLSSGYHGEDWFGLLFLGQSDAFTLEAFKATDGLLNIIKANPKRLPPTKNQKQGDINWSYYKDLHLTASFQPSEIAHHIAVIMDPALLLKETNHLVNTHPKYVEDFKKLNSERKAADLAPVTMPEVTEIARADAFTWLHTTFMYLTMVGALDGSELFKEWFEKDMPFFETALRKARAQGGSTKQSTH